MPMIDKVSAEDPVTKKTARKRGRPSTYSVETTEVILRASGLRGNSQANLL